MNWFWIILLFPILSYANFEQMDQMVLPVAIKLEKDSSLAGNGTGFVVRNDGYLVTNFHVVSELFKKSKHKNPYKVFVIMKGNQNLEAKIVDIDIVNDLAILKVPHQFESQLTLSEMPLNKGQKIYSLGYHDKLFLSINHGTFNDYLKESDKNLMAISAPVNPGMSGGPIINENSEVVGVNVMKEGNKESAAYGIDVNHVKAMLSKLAEGQTERDLSKLMDDQFKQTYKIMNEALKRPMKGQKFGSWELVNFENILACGESESDINPDNDKGDKNQNRVVVQNKVCTVDPRKLPLSVLDARIGVVYLFSNVRASTNTPTLFFYDYINDQFKFKNLEAWVSQRKARYKCTKKNIENDHGIKFRVSLCAWETSDVPSFFHSNDYFNFELNAASLSEKKDALLIQMKFSTNKETATTVVSQLLGQIKKVRP